MSSYQVAEALANMRRRAQADAALDDIMEWLCSLPSGEIDNLLIDFQKTLTKLKHKPGQRVLELQPGHEEIAMSLEEVIKANTAALEANTAAILKGGKAASGGAAAASGGTKAATSKNSAAEVQALLTKVKDEVSKEKAKELIKNVGGVDKMADIPTEKLDAVFDAATKALAEKAGSASEDI